MPVFPKRTACIAASALLSVSAFAADCINGINASSCTVPAGAGSVTIEAWGGGGGGGGGGSFFFGGGGGGGGSYCGATFAVVPGAPLTVTVGSGGAGGTPTVSGTPGTPSSVMGAGIAGMAANAGSGGAGAPSGAGGAGGNTDACTATNAAKWPGGHGADGELIDGGGGGGSATALGAGGDGVGYHWRYGGRSGRQWQHGRQ